MVVGNAAHLATHPEYHAAAVRPRPISDDYLGGAHVFAPVPLKHVVGALADPAAADMQQLVPAA